MGVTQLEQGESFDREASTPRLATTPGDQSSVQPKGGKRPLLGLPECDDLAPATMSGRVFRPLRYRPGGIGNWSGHLAFAHDLIAHLRPRTIVELGTHFGESYFGFCQAVVENGVSASCYAVDTWKGEAHAGLYGEEVFADVQSHNQSLYGAFSHLLRCTFDDAAEKFSEHSIDLLHIDGLHTYEAVSRDFRQWLPKVRPGGCILLHDIAERHEDFGVWRLWDEIASEFPNFCFTHSHGLGIIRISPISPSHESDDSFFRFLFEGSASLHAKIRRYYEILAENLEMRSQLQQRRTGNSVFQVFPWGEQGHEERSSIRVDVMSDVPQRVSCMVGGAIAGSSLRIDPCNHAALIEITCISLRLPDGPMLWSFQPSSMADLRVTGTAVQLSGSPSTLIVYSFGDDPQFLVPVGNLASGQSFLLEIDLRIDTDAGALVPFLGRFTPWTGPRTDPSRVNAAMELFERECAHLNG